MSTLTDLTRVTVSISHQGCQKCLQFLQKRKRHQFSLLLRCLQKKKSEKNQKKSRKLLSWQIRYIFIFGKPVTVTRWRRNNDILIGKKKKKQTWKEKIIIKWAGKFFFYFFKPGGTTYQFPPVKCFIIQKVRIVENFFSFTASKDEHVWGWHIWHCGMFPSRGRNISGTCQLCPRHLYFLFYFFFFERFLTVLTGVRVTGGSYLAGVKLEQVVQRKLWIFPSTKNDKGSLTVLTAGMENSLRRRQTSDQRFFKLFVNRYVTPKCPNL